MASEISEEALEALAEALVIALSGWQAPGFGESYCRNRIDELTKRLALVRRLTELLSEIDPEGDETKRAIETMAGLERRIQRLNAELKGDRNA